MHVSSHKLAAVISMTRNSGLKRSARRASVGIAMSTFAEENFSVFFFCVVTALLSVHCKIFSIILSVQVP
jgi:hypothetical protein